MAPNVLLTGATGFVGGDVLHALTTAHPDWPVTCPVRSNAGAGAVSAAYPRARVVVGSSAELLAREARGADIVIHAAASCDDEPAAAALAAGLAARSAARGPAFWIHSGGALCLAAGSVQSGRWGAAVGREYDDWDRVAELTGLPEHAPHRPVDRLVLGAAAPGSVRTAIVAAAIVYGRGRGPVRTASFSPFAGFLRRRRVFAVGAGTNVWHCVHVRDLSDLYLRLAEAAARGEPASWDDQGYYLAENGRFVMADMLQRVAAAALRRGLVADADIESVSPDEADRRAPPMGKIWLGADSRGVALRARKLLGWDPHHPSFEDEIEASLDVEARALGVGQDTHT